MKQTNPSVQTHMCRFTSAILRTKYPLKPGDSSNEDGRGADVAEDGKCRTEGAARRLSLCSPADALVELSPVLLDVPSPGLPDTSQSSLGKSITAMRS